MGDAVCRPSRAADHIRQHRTDGRGKYATQLENYVASSHCESPVVARLGELAAEVRYNTDDTDVLQ